MIGPGPKSAAAVGAILGVLVVGMVDYHTSAELRTFPLYFLPLVLVAWFLGTTAAVIASGVATMVWMALLYLGGRQYTDVSVWIINFCTQGSAFLLVSVLVARLRDALLRERALGRTDPLTGLSNRRSFFEQAEHLVALCHRNGRPITLAYIDLDNFKNANDTLGHQQGDELLRKVAEIFSRYLRSSDVTGRVGGDEFIVLLPETDGEHAGLVLEKVRAAIAREPQFLMSSVTASVGAISYSSAPSELPGMVRAADNLLYSVKASSKNRVHITYA